MSLFLRLSIGVRLACGFAVVLLFLLVVAVSGLRGVSEVTDDLHTMYEDRAIPVEQLGEVNRLLVRNRVLVMDMMAFPTAQNIAKRDEELKKNIEAVSATWDKFSKSRMSDAVRRSAGSVSVRRIASISAVVVGRPSIVYAKPWSFAACAISAAIRCRTSVRAVCEVPPALCRIVSSSRTCSGASSRLRRR